MKRKSFIVILIVVLVLAGGFFLFGRDKGPEVDFVAAERGELVQDVNITGRVKPSDSVNLAFEKSGRVARVSVDVGDSAVPGEVLVSLENGDIVAQMRQAEASVAGQEAKLLELQRGSRPEEVVVQETKVKSAETSMTNARVGLVDKLNDAFTKADDSVRNKVDQFITNPRSVDPEIDFSVADSQLKADIEWERFLLEETLNGWQASLLGVSVGSDLEEAATSANKNLSQTKSFLDKVSLAVNILQAGGSLTQTTIDGYKADVSTARMNVNTAITNLSTAEEKLSSAESTLSLEKEQLALLLSGTPEEQIAAQKAKVDEAKASVSNFQAQVAKTIIRSPIRGVVTKQDAKVGEIVPANTNIVSLISASEFEIETQVPEADIAKLELGDKASVTLDAYEDDVVFTASVSKIDPAETIVEGVPTYKVTLQFDEPSELVRSGMTADITIATDRKENVIAVPGRAVRVVEGGQRVVRIVSERGEIRDVPVVLGLRGSDGRVEIVSGVSEGDRVVVFLEEE